MTTGRILVVDDEINIRGALVTLLEKKGYQVRGAGTGEDALEQLETATADVLTDLKMPGMGGMEFLRRLKQKWPDTEVLVMTAYGSIDTAVEAMRCGAYDYLTKPIDRERFLWRWRKHSNVTPWRSKTSSSRIVSKPGRVSIIWSAKASPCRASTAWSTWWPIATSPFCSQEKAEPERSSLPVQSITKVTGRTVRSLP